MREGCIGSSFYLQTFKIDLMIKYSLGIDISMKIFHACLSVIDSNQQVKLKARRKFPNTVAGFKELYDWILKHPKHKDIPLQIVIEATGVYYEHCAMYLFKRDWQFQLFCPASQKNICRQQD